MTSLAGLKLIDLFMIAGYFAAVMAIGFWASRKVKSDDDFFLGGRRFSSPALDHALAVHRHPQRDGRPGRRCDRPRRIGRDLVPVDVALLHTLLLVDRSHHAQAPGHHHRRLFPHPLRQKPGNALRHGRPLLFRPLDRALAARAPAQRSQGRPEAQSAPMRP